MYSRQSGKYSPPNLTRLLGGGIRTSDIHTPQKQISATSSTHAALKSVAKPQHIPLLDLLCVKAKAFLSSVVLTLSVCFKRRGRSVNRREIRRGFYSNTCMVGRNFRRLHEN